MPTGERIEPAADCPLPSRSGLWTTHRRPDIIPPWVLAARASVAPMGHWVPASLSRLRLGAATALVTLAAGNAHADPPPRTQTRLDQSGKPYEIDLEHDAGGLIFSFGGGITMPLEASAAPRWRIAVDIGGTAYTPAGLSRTLHDFGLGLSVDKFRRGSDTIVSETFGIWYRYLQRADPLEWGLRVAPVVRAGVRPDRDEKPSAQIGLDVAPEVYWRLDRTVWIGLSPTYQLSAPTFTGRTASPVNGLAITASVVLVPFN